MCSHFISVQYKSSDMQPHSLQRDQIKWPCSPSASGIICIEYSITLLLFTLQWSNQENVISICSNMLLLIKYYNSFISGENLDSCWCPPPKKNFLDQISSHLQQQLILFFLLSDISGQIWRQTFLVFNHPSEAIHTWKSTNSKRELRCVDQLVIGVECIFNPYT